MGSSSKTDVWEINGDRIRKQTRDKANEKQKAGITGFFGKFEGSVFLRRILRTLKQ